MYLTMMINILQITQKQQSTSLLINKNLLIALRIMGQQSPLVYWPAHSDKLRVNEDFV